jgi:hypothetical protein
LATFSFGEKTSEDVMSTLCQQNTSIAKQQSSRVIAPTISALDYAAAAKVIGAMGERERTLGSNLSRSAIHTGNRISPSMKRPKIPQ